MTHGVALLAMILALAGTPQGDESASEPTITRATAVLNGVFSPRGFFNITVRLYQYPEVEWAKFDLKKSRITLDFSPGVTVTPGEIQQIMIDAGYKPGPVTIELVPLNEVSETGPGWMKIKHPNSRNPIIRWFELNF